MEYNGKSIPRYALTRGTRYPQEVKDQVVALKRQGFSYNQICEKLDIGVTNRTMRIWLRKAGFYCEDDDV